MMFSIDFIVFIRLSLVVNKNNINEENDNDKNGDNDDSNVIISIFRLEFGPK